VVEKRAGLRGGCERSEKPLRSFGGVRGESSKEKRLFLSSPHLIYSYATLRDNRLSFDASLRPSINKLLLVASLAAALPMTTRYAVTALSRTDDNTTPQTSCYVMTAITVNLCTIMISVS